MNKEQYIKKICDILLGIERTVQAYNRLGMFDINEFCEDFYCEFLNKVYDANFENVNFETKNAAYVDLVDRKNGECIQVTSQNTADKIEYTINNFISSEMYKTYNRLYFIMIAGKKETRKKFDTQDKFVFNNKRDIIDATDLCEVIRKKDDLLDIKAILEFLELQTKINPVICNFEDITKSEEVIDKNYIERKVCALDKYNEFYTNNANYIDLFELSKNEQKIIILSDAGYGKSELLKNLNNQINQNEFELCAFYFRLNKYTNQKIEELKPEAYNSVPNSAVVFILDAFDEIEENNKNTFLKNLEFFLERNSDTKVILSCRTNFYKAGKNPSTNYIKDFKPYLLLPFNQDDIKFLLNKNEIVYDKFVDEINNKGLSNLISNPFYLIKAITKYKTDNVLPVRNRFIKELIYDTFEFDKDKYNTTKELDDEKNLLYRVLKSVALFMECLGRNYITKEELETIINNKEHIALLKFSGIWTKNNDNYSFTHNNFGEFLASELMKTFDIEDIKKLITYESNPRMINESWLNTISFLVDDYKNVELKNWLVETMPECLYYFEKNDINEETRILMFKNVFEIFEQKRIWLPNSLMYRNESFIDFIGASETVDYLLSKIQENKHYTIVYNALSVLMNFKSLYNKENEVKKILLEICNCDTYYSQAKRYALTILADNDLITDDELLIIIENNKNAENQYLRTGYFYCINKFGLNLSNYQVVTNKFEIVKKGLTASWNDDEDNEDDINLMDEGLEYDKCFSNIKDIETFIKIIDFIEQLDRKQILHSLSETIIKNICWSFINLYPNNNESFDYILKFYLIFENNFDNDGLKIIPEELDKIGLRLELFKGYMKLDKKRRFYSDYYLIDNNCLEYFISEYENKKYNDERAKEILYNSNTNNSSYKKLNTIYAERTGVNVIEERSKGNKKEISPGNYKQDFFNSIFNQEKFLEVFDEFLTSLNKVEITKDDIKNIEYDFFSNNEKLECMEDFLRHFQTKDDKITKEKLLNMDWTYFQISYIHYMLNHNEELSVDDKQKEYIYELCLNELKNISFENSITYKENGKSFTTNRLNIYIWYFRFRFDFVFPENVLLDMLDFDWTMPDYKTTGIDYIINSVPKEKIDERIISNIENKIMYDKVLNNHIEYCIENNLRNLSSNIEQYLLNSELQPFEKDSTVDYLIFDLGAQTFIDKYMDKINYDTHLLCLEKLYNSDKDVLISYLNNKILETNEEKEILEYSRYLINCNELSGLKAYYDVVSKKMRNPDVSHSNSITNAISKVNDIQLLDLICDLFLLTFNKDFKDSRFESIYNGCKNAFINIGLYDDNYEKTINKLNEMVNQNSDIQNIGFTYYIIDELTLKHYQNNQATKDINQIINEINSIISKKPKSTGIIINF